MEFELGSIMEFFRWEASTQLNFRRFYEEWSMISMVRPW